MTACLGGEIGRHNGLKIRRFVHSGRAGSIPARGTIFMRLLTSRSVRSHVAVACEACVSVSYAGCMGLLPRPMSAL